LKESALAMRKKIDREEAFLDQKFKKYKAAHHPKPAS
jgi:hypothetical protein